jgi:hypothetical protein
MKHGDEKAPLSEGEGQDLAQAEREFELRSANRLSDVERGVIQHGIDAAKLGNFAPQDEMDEFYRLHRGA